MKNDEKIVSTLIRMQQLEQIKVTVLGELYAKLGNVIWRILSTIHLQEIDGVDLSLVDLAQAMIVPDTLVSRLIVLLEAERLIEVSKEPQSERNGRLSLTELGRLKITQIVDRIEIDSSRDLGSADMKMLFAQI